MKKFLMVIGVILFLIVVFVMWYINGLNKIVRMHESVKQSWAQIDNELKRRSDLIPNLVQTVKGYAKHEKSIFTEIAAARAKLAGAGSVKDKISASNNLEGALSRLLVVVEQYPNLKANETFQRLMDELAGTENRIAVERMRYNRDVQTFNTYIREVIGSFFAKQKGFLEPLPYFEVPNNEKIAPKVEFE
jgi:LemA protein